MLKEKFFPLEEAIAKKSIDNITFTLTQNVESAALASFFLRNVKGRADIGQAILKSTVDSVHDGKSIFISKIEQIRNSLSKGNLVDAERILVQIDAQTDEEKSELYLEKARLALYSGKNNACIEIAEKSLELNPHPLTRMTLLQIQGHAFINLNQYHAALEKLILGKEISVLFPYASSASCIRRFLVKAYILNNQISKANTEMHEFLELLNSWEKDAQWLERLQIALRAESELQTALKNNSQAILALKECLEISNWLEDKTTENRCLEDMKQFSILELKVQNNAIIAKNLWSFLKRHQVLLNKGQKSFHLLSNSPISSGLIEVACIKPLPHEDVFLQVWNLNYNKERHAQHLRMALSKLRKILPPECVISSNGFVEVK